MGEIVLATLLRLSLTLVFIAYTWLYYPYMWRVPIALLIVSLTVFLPARKSYAAFKEKQNDELSGTLCAMCKHFDATAVICLKHDEHPTREYLPCDGIDWEAGKPYNASGDIFENHERRKREEDD